MKKVLLVFILSLGFSCKTFASDIFLKQDIIVKDEYIKLSDIFVGIDKTKDKIIAPAPLPSKTSYFNYDALSSLSRRHNINWQSNSGNESVSITRSFQTIDSSEIIAAIKASDFFQDNFTNDETFESRTLKNINIAENITYEINVVDITYNSKNNNLRSEINIINGDKVLENIKINGKVYTMTETPVLKKSLSSGMVIFESDIEFIKVRSDDLKQKAITDITNLIGKEAKKTLKPGVILTTNDVKTPILVEKSKMVKVLYKKRNMTLSYVGKSLEDGSMGDFIRFQAASGTNVLQGEVIAANTIMVSTSSDIQ